MFYIMSIWLNDSSANKLKNTYFQDTHNENFAIDISGDTVIRSDHSLRFENTTIGSHIGDDVSSNLIDGSNNILIGNNSNYERLKQWNVVDIQQQVSNCNKLNSVVYGDEYKRFVAVGDNFEIIYSDDGYTWADVSSNDLSYNNASIGVKKIVISKDGMFSLNEIQVWANTNAEGFVNLLDTDLSANSDTNLTQWNQGLDFFDVYSSSNITIHFSTAYKFEEIVSIVLYNRHVNNTDISGATLFIYDDEDNEVYRQVMGSENIIQFQHNNFGTYVTNNNIPLSGADSSTNIIDSDVSFNFNKVRISKSNSTFWLSNVRLLNETSSTEIENVGVNGNDLSFNKIEIQYGKDEVFDDNPGEDISYNSSSLYLSTFNKNTGNIKWELTDGYITLRNLQYLKIDDLLTVDSSNILTSSTVTFYRDASAIYSFDFTFNASDSDPTRVSDASFVFIGPDYAATYDFNDSTVDNYKKVILNNNVGSTTPTITDNKLNNVDIDVEYNSLIINYDVSYSNFDFSSLVIYPGGILTNDDDEDERQMRLESLYGVEVEFLLHDTVQYKHKIYDISVNGLTAKAYRFDGNGNKNFYNGGGAGQYNGSGISFNDFVEYYSQNYIIDNSNIVDGEKAVQVISTIPTIQSYDLIGRPAINNKSINSITYGEKDGSGVYVAVGNKVILSSVNGKTWYITTFNKQDSIDNGGATGKDQNWSSVTFGNGRFVAVAPDSNAYYNDVDLTSVTRIKEWKQYSSFLMSNVNFRSITFGNEKFVAVSDDGVFNIVSIPFNEIEGKDFTNDDIPFFDDVITSNPYVSISFGNDQFVVIDNNDVAISSDSAIWTAVNDNNFIDSSWNSLRFLNNQFLAVSNSGTKKLAYVNDPTSSWNNLRIKPGIWNDIAYGNDNYVIVGNSENDNSVGALLINDGVLNNSVVLGNTSEANYHNSLVLGNNSHSENENQIILGNANHFVGIRQPDPVFPLDVSGNINFTGQLLQNSSENIGIKTNIPRVTLDVSANDAIIIPVGTTSQRPNYDAKEPNSNGIVGAIRYNIETDQFEGFGTPYNGDGYWGSLGGVKDIDGDTYITAQQEEDDDDVLRFVNDGSTNMIIDASGRVGIGTDVKEGQLDASASLHVFGNSRIEGSLYLGTKYPEGSNDGTDFAKIYMDISGGTNLVIETGNDVSDNIIFKTKDTELMRISGNGNIGIGVNVKEGQLDASTSLHVFGNSRIEGSLSLGTKYPEGGNDGTDFAKIYMDKSDGTNLVIESGNDVSDNIIFKTKDTESMRISGNGNVGIGTTSPADLLHVKSTGDARFILEADSNNSSNESDNSSIELWQDGRRVKDFFGHNSGDNDLIIGHISGNSSIRFATNNSSDGQNLTMTDLTTRMTILTSNGNVGIGTTTPFAMLDVNGQVQATSFNATSDIRFKSNISPIEDSLEKILQIKGVTYTMNKDKNKQVGFIAQDIEKIIPEVVYTDNSEEQYKSISYGNITALIVEAIKELKNENNKLNEELHILKQKM